MSDGVATKRLYYTDAYLAEFSAAVSERSADGTRVYLEETAFYPTSGGQPHDLGTLGGVPVTDVVDEGERIAHVLSAPLPERSRVDGVVDRRRRFDHMQQHTGQHLLSAVFEELFGYATVSVHFGQESSTLDLDAEGLTAEELLRAETRVNALVAENRAVTVSFEDAASATGLRKASGRDGVLRIVSIADLDRSACGGTHVRSTAEIGPTLLRGVERVRRSTRVEFLCGSRAIRRARRDFESLTRIAASFSASIDDAPGIVESHVARMKELDNERKKMEKELSGFRIRARYEAASNTEDQGGVRTIVIRDAGSMDELRALAQAAYSLPRSIVVGVLTQPPSVLVASTEDSGFDAGRALKERLAAAGGRGGGSPRLAQGSVPDLAALETVVTALVNRGQ